MEKWRLVYLAKNMKAFYLASPGTIESDLKFIKKRFRYRRIGILKEQARLLPQPVSEPLVILDENEISPFYELRPLKEILAKIVPLASLFMVPILSSKDWLARWQPYFCWALRREKSFSSQEFHFVLRLLTYIPIDLAEKEEERVRLALKKKEWPGYFKLRLERLAQDATKRFWRWPEERSGEIKLGLVDPISLLPSLPSPDEFPFINPVGIFFIHD